MREFQIIEKYFKPLTNSHKASQNLADDVAKISLKKDEELIVSTDMFVEDVHFLRADGAFKIASKLLLTNISDLASAGATPLYYTLGFSKNKNINEKFVAEFSRGLKSVQDEFDLCLIGGDTVTSQKLFYSITIFGSVKKGQALSRAKAKSGDLIFVSGTIGDAFLGLNFRDDEYLINRHFFPTPRIKLGRKLLDNSLSNCAVDISDGLLSDLKHICESSKLAAEIHLEKIPLSKSAKNFLEKNKKIKAVDLLSGGDDYELVFSINSKNLKKIAEISKSLKLDLSCIGTFKKAADKKFDVTLFNEKNQKIKIKKFGYEH